MSARELHPSSSAQHEVLPYRGVTRAIGLCLQVYGFRRLLMPPSAELHTDLSPRVKYTYLSSDETLRGIPGQRDRDLIEYPSL